MEPTDPVSPPPAERRRSGRIVVAATAAAALLIGVVVAMSGGDSSTDDEATTTTREAIKLGTSGPWERVSDIVVTPDNRVVVADRDNRRIGVLEGGGRVGVVAGTGGGGRSGDGGPATDALLGAISGLAVDPSGNLYVADEEEHVVRRIDPAGVITTVAGTGKPGFSGDGGPALQASLDGVGAVAADASGNLVVFDRRNRRIRRIDASGTITTLAQLREQDDRTPDLTRDRSAGEPLGPGKVDGLVAGTSGIYISDTLQHRVWKLGDGGKFEPFAGRPLIAPEGETVFLHPDGFWGDGGAAVSAGLSGPVGIAFGPGEALYVADNGNNRIRRIDPSGVISTIAGRGCPTNSSGDGAPAHQAGLSRPTRIAVDSGGTAFVLEEGLTFRRIRKIDAASGSIATIHGEPSPPLAPPSFTATEFRAGVLADGRAGRVLGLLGGWLTRYDGPGAVTVLAGFSSRDSGFSGDGGPAHLACFRDPFGLWTEGNGDVYVADKGNHRVRRIEAATGTITTVAGAGAPGFAGDAGPAVAAQLFEPAGIAFDNSGHLLIADTGNHRIRRVDPAGVITTVAGTGGEGMTGDRGPATQAEIGSPIALGFSPGGDLFFTDLDHHALRKIDASGTIDTVAGGPEASTPLVAPAALVFSDDGTVVVGERERIVAIRPDGARVVLVDEKNPALPDFFTLRGVTAGPGRTLLFSDGNGLVYELGPDGTRAFGRTEPPAGTPPSTG